MLNSFPSIFLFVVELNGKPILKQQQRRRLTFIFTMYIIFFISITDTENDNVEIKSQKIDFHFNFVIGIITISGNGKSCFSLSAFVCRIHLYMFCICTKCWIPFSVYIYVSGMNTLLLNSIIIIMVKKGY